jgi:ribulose bisphosphate carboxylase small subunit
VEENLDFYRENLTYIDMEYTGINRFRNHIWEMWRSRGNDQKENRKHF